MALIECAECANQVSDKAAACPRCGAPIASESNSPPEPASTTSQPVKRAGGAYEGVGFLLIVAGMLSGMMGAAPGLAWTIALAGIVIFIVGRFN